MDINDRFVLFLRETGQTQIDFSRQTGFSNYNLSKFLTGTVKSIKIDLAVVLAKYYPNLNLRWFLIGEGKMWIDKQNKSENTMENRVNHLEKEVSDLKGQLIKILSH